MAIKIITPSEARELIEKGALIVDIRPESDYSAEHIEGAKNVPMDRVSPQTLPTDEGQSVIFYCRSGVRSSAAGSALAESINGTAYSLRGGIVAWKKEGFPVKTGPKLKMELFRQVQITAGITITLGVLLGAFVSSWFYLIPFIVGIALIFAGISGVCLVTICLMRMPWNK